MLCPPFTLHPPMLETTAYWKYVAAMLGPAWMTHATRAHRFVQSSEKRSPPRKASKSRCTSEPMSYAVVRCCAAAHDEQSENAMRKCAAPSPYALATGPESAALLRGE
eukprot:4239196-Prymnesium_polylepis.1